MRSTLIVLVVIVIACGKALAQVPPPDQMPARATAGEITAAAAPQGLRFVPLSPCRIADTRTAAGPFGGPQMASSETRSFTVPSSLCGVPSTAQAYSLNVAVVPAGPLGFLTVW